jgi:hypothetical protein
VVRIAVGLQDSAYVDVLIGVVERAFGMTPSVTEGKAARALYVNLHSKEAVGLLAPFKQRSLWRFDGIQFPDMVLAGICDTDGGWQGRNKKRYRFSITQKNNGNLESSLPLWQAMGFQPSLSHYGYRAILSVPAAQRGDFLAKIPLMHPRKKLLTVSVQ